MFFVSTYSFVWYTYLAAIKQILIVVEKSLYDMKEFSLVSLQLWPYHVHATYSRRCLRIVQERLFTRHIPREFIVWDFVSLSALLRICLMKCVLLLIVLKFAVLHGEATFAYLSCFREDKIYTYSLDWVFRFCHVHFWVKEPRLTFYSIDRPMIQLLRSSIESR